MAVHLFGKFLLFSAARELGIRFRNAVCDNTVVSCRRFRDVLPIRHLQLFHSSGFSRVFTDILARVIFVRVQRGTRPRRVHRTLYTYIYVSGRKHADVLSHADLACHGGTLRSQRLRNTIPAGINAKRVHAPTPIHDYCTHKHTHTYIHV